MIWLLALWCLGASRGDVGAYSKALTAVYETSEVNYEWTQSSPLIWPEVKHRYDFASFDSGARIVESAFSLSKVKSVLSPNSESYMIGPCDQTAWFVVALPEQISVEFVSLHFTELFSSYYGKVALFGASSFPTPEWRLLGLLDLDPIKQTELFDLRGFCSRLRSPGCWVKHLKLQFISYYPLSDAPLCTLTQFRAFGTTLMQELESRLVRNQVGGGQEGTKMDKAEDTSCPSEAELFENADVFGRETNRSDTFAEETSLSATKRPSREVEDLWSRWIDTEQVDKETPRSRWSEHAFSIPLESPVRLLFEAAEFNAVCPIDPPGPPDPGPWATANEKMKSLKQELEEDLKSRKQEQPAAHEETEPPLLALADRLSGLETQVRTESGTTFRRLNMFKEILHTIAGAVENAEKIAIELDFALDRHLFTEEAWESLYASQILTNSLRVVCQHLLPEFAWGNSNGRRSVCTLAAALRNVDARDARALRTKVAELSLVSELGLKAAIEHRLRRLQSLASMGPEGPDGKDPGRRKRLEAIVKAGHEYRDYLKEQSSVYGIRYIVSLVGWLTDLVRYTTWNGEFLLMNLPIFGWYEAVTDHVESDALATYVQICFLELTHIFRLWHCIQLLLVAVLFDVLLRTRELEALLRSLLDEDIPPLPSPSEEEMYPPAEGSDRSSRRAESPSSSPLRFNGFNSLSLALEPIHRYWSPFRRRYTLLSEGTRPRSRSMRRPQVEQMRSRAGGRALSHSELLRRHSDSSINSDRQDCEPQTAPVPTSPPLPPVLSGVASGHLQQNPHLSSNDSPSP